MRARRPYPQLFTQQRRSLQRIDAAALRATAAQSFSSINWTKVGKGVAIGAGALAALVVAKKALHAVAVAVVV